MNNFIDKTCETLDILKNYKGSNPFIIELKNNIIIRKNSSLNNFTEEYIRTNFDKEPKQINKMVKLADWFGESKIDEWGIKAEKLFISYYMGETSKCYHVYGRYRRSQDRYVSLFLPKEAVLTDFLTEDWSKLNIDFTKYNEKSGRVIKPHQERGVKFLLTRKKAILSAIMGSGKSFTSIIAALEGGFKKILIVCPASVKTTWQDELRYLVDDEEITIIEGSKWKETKFTIINFDILDRFYEIPTEKVKRKKKIVSEDGKVSYEIVEKEVVSRKKEIIDKAMQDSQLFQSQFDCIIIDEAHKLSNKTSNRTKIILDLIKRSNPKSIFCLTGTMITNNTENLFNLLKIIDAPIAKDWNKYALRYCGGKQIYLKKERDIFTNVFLKRKRKASWYDLTYDEKQELNQYLDRNARKIMLTNGATNLEELQERIKHLYLRETDLGNSLDIKTETIIKEYDLTPKERVEYDIAWNTYLQERNESNTEALKKLTENRQLIEGSVFRQLVATYMVSRSIKLAEEEIKQGNKVIIFCCFDKELYSLQEYFGDRCVIYNGKMNMKQKDAAKERFANDEECKVFIGNLSSASVGLTLIAANVIIFNQIDFTPAVNEQAEYRIKRLGQKKDCRIYYQKFLNTYMERMFEILEIKNNIIDKVILSEDRKNV